MNLLAIMGCLIVIGGIVGIVVDMWKDARDRKARAVKWDNMLKQIDSVIEHNRKMRQELLKLDKKITRR